MKESVKRLKRKEGTDRRCTPESQRMHSRTGTMGASQEVSLRFQPLLFALVSVFFCPGGDFERLPGMGDNTEGIKIHSYLMYLKMTCL